jgi:hypothetical protein
VLQIKTHINEGYRSIIALTLHHLPIVVYREVGYLKLNAVWERWYKLECSQLRRFFIYFVTKFTIMTTHYCKYGIIYKLNITFLPLYLKTNALRPKHHAIKSFKQSKQ